MECDEYRDERIKLPIALGKDIGGEAVMADLSRMPHLLIAGTTGSGKSVAVNAMILSLLFKSTPEHVRMIMIDPKMLELSVYDGIPHLLAPVFTDPKKAVVALKWVVREMEDRYRRMAALGVRNITGYNRKVREAIDRGERLPKITQEIRLVSDNAVYAYADPNLEGLPEFEKQMLRLGPENLTRLQGWMSEFNQVYAKP